MWLFNKKKKVEETPKPICQHKYKDFPWYDISKYNIDTKTLRVDIYKPYVCIHCGYRENILLESIQRIGISFEEALEVRKEFCSIYDDKLQCKAIVEDMINDMVLVDKKYIEIYEKLHPMNI